MSVAWSCALALVALRSRVHHHALRAACHTSYYVACYACYACALGRQHRKLYMGCCAIALSEWRTRRTLGARVTAAYLLLRGVYLVACPSHSLTALAWMLVRDGAVGVGLFSCLVLLREEALSLLIAIEVEARYFFHIG